MKKKLLSLLGVFAFILNANAQTVLTQWNFNDQTNTASIGNGTIGNIGAITNTYASGSAGIGSSDPVTPTTNNYAYNTTTYPAVSTGEKTAGIEIAVSTLNRQGISITFDVRLSNTASRYLTLQYSTNGTSFTDAITYESTPGDTWYNAKTFDFTAITALNNNANAKFRIVTAFAPSTTNYVAATTTSNYGTGGTLRYDMITVSYTTTLPISLTTFTGKEVNKTILLNWATASEKNNKTFEVLRSIDAKSFVSIGEVASSGNSDTEKNYSFTDENPYAGVNYYQLKQVNFDGTSSVSEIKAVDSKIAATQLAISPTESGIKVIINSANETNSTLSLFNMNGQKISTKKINLSKGYNDVLFTESLISGTYFINLVSDGKTSSVKFIK